MDYFRDYDYRIQKEKQKKDAYYDEEKTTWEEENTTFIPLKDEGLNTIYSQPNPRNINIRLKKNEDK